MTISTTTNRVTYTGNAVTVAFAFPYAFFGTTDLVVVETIIATGVQTTKALTTDYTISGSVDALGHYSGGGTVTAVTAPASTVTWTIYRDPAAIQVTDLVENDPMPAESIEAALDYQTMLNQRTRDIAARSLQQPEGDSATIARLPAKVARASTYLGFDANGDPIASTTATGYPASTFMATVLDDTTALMARTTLGVQPTQFVATVGGTANAITLTPTEAITAYAAGQRFSFVAALSNTGDTTVAISGLAAKTIQKTGYGLSSTILYPRDIAANALVVIELAASGGNFNLVSVSHPQEITWTPSLGGNTTYTAQQGRAWRFGMLVVVTCQLTINAIGTGSTSMISGLPKAYYGVGTGAVYFETSSTNVTSITAVTVNTTDIVLYSTTAAQTSMAQNAIFKNGTVVNFSMAYLTAA